MLESSSFSVLKKFGVLHRLEIDSRRGEILLVVPSAFKPIWNFTDDVLLEGSFLQKEIGQIYSILRNETDLMFRIRANQTKCVSAKKRGYAKVAGRRVELRTTEDQIEWLKRKSEQHDFHLTSVKFNSEVESVATTPNDKVFGNHSKEKLNVIRWFLTEICR